MTNNLKSALVTVGAVAMAAVWVPVAHSAAHGLTATTIQLSAQKEKKKGAQGGQHGTPMQHSAPIQHRMQVQHSVPKVNKAVRGTNRHVGTSRQRTPQKSFLEPKRKSITSTGIPKGVEHKRVVNKNVRKFELHGAKAHVVVAPKFRGMPVHGVGHAFIGGRNYSVWRGSRRFRYHGGWRTFVALGALGALAIGAYEFYPYAYLDAPQPYCDGLTEDGCQLVWQDVETVEGDVIPQCVAYCPWQ
jgi:hypothetical protein